MPKGTTPFKRDFSPLIGEAVLLHPMLRRIVAPNPSAMTYTGTNSYLVGNSEIAVIDPGPNDTSHLNAILAAVNGGRITRICITHSHIDHTGLVPRLKSLTGARVLAHSGGNEIKKSKNLGSLFCGLGGGEGVDTDFSADVFVEDGEIIQGVGWSLEVVWTPGHMGNHVCFAWRQGNALFSGDHIMGWSTTVVSPPHGRMSDFMSSLKRLKGRDEGIFYPGHGDAVNDPQAMIDFQFNHRIERERQIVRAIGNGFTSANKIAKCIYTDLPEELIQMAARSVFAHLIDLHDRCLLEIECRDQLKFDSEFRLTKKWNLLESDFNI